jgi:hypothetical protein
MNEQKIHQLLQIKSHECSSAEMLEEFILEFHRRQKALSTTESFLEKIKDQISFFFSELPIPRIAYVAATVVALFCGIIILQTTSSAPNENASSASLLSSDHFSAIHYYSTPMIEKDEEEPVSFECNERENDSLFSPASHILQKKSSSKQYLMSL